MITLWHGDCLELMKNIPDKSIDMVLTDPPYGVSAGKWDNSIPYAPMWSEIKRVCKDSNAVVLFGNEPFASKLRLSNIEMYKYDWIWKKKNPSNFLSAKKRPLGIYETISVFSLKPHAYFPQNLIKIDKVSNYPDKTKNRMLGQKDAKRVMLKQEFTNYPRNILEFSKEYGYHTSQKPVALLEYLIKTYTLENEIVLDFSAGSFTTGVACVNINRKFIGIELDKNYFDIGVNRIKERIKCLDLKIEPMISMGD